MNKTNKQQNKKEEGLFDDILPFFKIKRKEKVVIISLKGIIRPDWTSSTGINAARVNRQLKKAFSYKNLKAVVFLINSPGGSPVQSQLIAKYAEDLSRKRKVPLYAVVEDLAASGGYWLAASAERIIAAEGSVIGSIGVISSGFGFQDLIKRIGVERRVYTAGANKKRLDPFVNAKEEDIVWLKSLQDELHKQFIKHIKDRRGKKLSSDTSLFEGEVWLAPEAKKLGLIDEIGHLDDFIEKKYGDKVKIIRMKDKGWGLSKFSTMFSSREEMLDKAIDSLEDRLFKNSSNIWN